MDGSKQTLTPAGNIPEKHLLALSWNIATEPTLYRELAVNPYTSQAGQIILDRFPQHSQAEVITAVIMAEPIGRYDRNFRQLKPELQAVESLEQANLTDALSSRLNEYYHQNTSEIRQLSSELLYDRLFNIAFASAEASEIGQLFSQKLRITLKLLIISYVEKLAQDKLVNNIAGKAKSRFSKKLQLKIFLAALYLVLLSFPVIGIYHQQLEHNHARKTPLFLDQNQQVLAAEMHPNQKLPVRLKIPSIEVDAAVIQMGLTADEAMEVPDNTKDVGWYKYGPSPGEMGSAVISGHFDGRKGRLGVFDNLEKLKPGDKIEVINDQGATITFVVRESRTYNPGYAAEVFLPNGNGTYLNLITCDGNWDVAKKSYTKRLVVFANLL